MAYSDFSMLQLARQFGLQERRRTLFGKATLTPIAATTRLLEDLADANRLPINSEKAKSEHLITPILREVWRLSGRQFTYYSGYSFNVDAERGLVGICDYLFSREESIEIKSPVFCLVEAKNRTVEEGIAQAFAEMYAAQVFNAQYGHPTTRVMGCVTNAFEWLFLELDGPIATIDTERYFVDEQTLPLLLSALLTVIKTDLSELWKPLP